MCHCTINAINEQFCDSFAQSDPMSLRQIGLSSLVKKSSNLNAEFDFLSSGSTVAAMPDEITAIAFLRSYLTLARINLITNVFPVTPESSSNSR